MIEHANRAWDIPCPNSQTKFVLIKLALMANEQHVCWPSKQFLARHLSTSVATVKRSIKWLVNEGWIEIRRRKNDKNNRDTTNMYYLKPVWKGVRVNPHGGQCEPQNSKGIDATLCHGSNEQPCAVPKAGASGGDNGDSASRRGQISDGEFCERVVDEFKDCPF